MRHTNQQPAQVLYTAYIITFHQSSCTTFCVIHFALLVFIKTIFVIFVYHNFIEMRLYSCYTPTQVVIFQSILIEVFIPAYRQYFNHFFTINRKSC